MHIMSILRPLIDDRLIITPRKLNNPIHSTHLYEINLLSIRAEIHIRNAPVEILRQESGYLLIAQVFENEASIVIWTPTPRSDPFNKMMRQRNDIHDAELRCSLLLAVFTVTGMWVVGEDGINTNEILVLRPAIRILIVEGADENQDLITLLEPKPIFILAQMLRWTTRLLLLSNNVQLPLAELVSLSQEIGDVSVIYGVGRWGWSVLQSLWIRGQSNGQTTFH